MTETATHGEPTRPGKVRRTARARPGIRPEPGAGAGADGPDPDGAARRPLGPPYDHDQWIRLMLDNTHAVSTVTAITLDRCRMISERLVRFSESVLRDRVTLTEALLQCDTPEELERLQGRFFDTTCRRYQTSGEHLIDLVTEAMRDITDCACSAGDHLTSKGNAAK